jgi:hypothetical protein
MRNFPAVRFYPDAEGFQKGLGVAPNLGRANAGEMQVFPGGDGLVAS